MGSDIERFDELGADSTASVSDTYKHIDEIPDDMDPVLRQWNMYMNVSPDVHVILLRYPEEQKDDPYADLKRSTPIEFRIKPVSGLIEVDVPIDPHTDIFDKIKGIIYGEAMRKSKVLKERGGSYGIAGGFGLGGPNSKTRPGPGQSADEADMTTEELLADYDEAIRNGHVMTKVTLGGHINVWNETSPNLYVARFEDSNVFFTKVDALCVLRPQLIHLDAVNDIRKSTLRMQAGADTEESEAVHVNMTIKKSEGDTDSVGDTSQVAKLLKAMREEPWQRLSWVEFDEAYNKFTDTLTSPERLRRPRLTCNMTNEQWLDAISCPRIDPINPNKSTMRATQKKDDLSSTDASEGEEEGEGGNVVPVEDDRENREEDGLNVRLAGPLLAYIGAVDDLSEPQMRTLELSLPRDVDKMSLPGLGLAAPQEVTTQPSTIHDLGEGTEWRFEVAFGASIEIKVLSGNAEIFGTELAHKQAYTFAGTKSAIYTWYGCRLEVTGDCQSEYIAEETPMIMYINLHFALERIREQAPVSGKQGPRVLILGPDNAGKTSLAKLLTAYANRAGRQPIVVNLDPREGMLSIPGTVSAAVFSTIIDVEQGWGSSPTNGPTQVPVKLPLVYYYGLVNPEERPDVYKPLVTRAALSAMNRLHEDEEAKAAGCIIDTPGVISQGKGGYDLIQHIISEFSVTVLITLGSERLFSEMVRRFNGQRTGISESLTVLKLDKSGGCVDRDTEYMQQLRRAQVREYFFGNAFNALSPHTQQVDFDQVSIFKIADSSALLSSLLPGGDDEDAHTASAIYEQIMPSPEMQNSVLAIVEAERNESPQDIRDANVIGFIYISEVDEKKRKLRVLAPASGRLPNRPMIWGAYPEAADLGH